MDGKLVGIGVGPGDPELITVKAVKVLKTADIIGIPKANKNKTSVAFSIVKDILDQRKNPPEILELVFPMTNNKKEIKDAWSKNAQIVAEKAKTGKTVAYITLGDPMVFSTFIYLCQRMQEEHPEVKLEIVPGVTSVTACAGASLIPLAEDNEVIAIIPSNVDSNRLIEIAKHANTLVLLKATKGLKELVPILEQSGFNENSTVAVVRRCTMPQENIIVGELKDVKNWDVPEDYFSISIIKEKIEVLTVLVDEKSTTLNNRH